MQAWQQFLTALENDLGAVTVDKWLRSLKVVHFDAGNLYLEATDSFQIAWFEEHVRSRARKQLVNNNFNPIKIHISGPSLGSAAKADEKSAIDHATTRPAFCLIKDELAPYATLLGFVTSDKNKMTLDLLASLANRGCASAQYNPIYVYGGSGTGKSHLLMALTKELCKNGVRALYVKMETFTENVVAAIRSGHMQDFRTMYRDTDVLLVDDMQVLAKKTATQEEFFHTFNTLHTSGRQIILSANCPPFMLCDIEPRLISRFEWGITLPLGTLEEKDIDKIIEKRLLSYGLRLDEESLKHLMRVFSYHLTSLHKAVDALALRASKTEDGISPHFTPEIIDKLLYDLLHHKKNSQLSQQKIVQTVAEFYGIKIEDILGRSQAQEYTAPRQIAMYLCREKIKAPFTQIGQFFQRDHSTVISSVNLIKDKLLKKEPSLPADLQSIEKKLGT